MEKIHNFAQIFRVFLYEIWREFIEILLMVVKDLSFNGLFSYPEGHLLIPKKKVLSFLESSEKKLKNFEKFSNKNIFLLIWSKRCCCGA